MNEARISDVTLRRAAKSKDLSLTFKERLETAKLLDRLGASVIEIEGITQTKVDSLRIKSIASIVRNSVLCVPVEMDEENIELVWAALAEARRPRLQVHAAVSPAQMEYIHHKKGEAMVEALTSAVAACKRLTDDVELVADDATRADRDFLSEVIGKTIEAGATTVTVADAAGTMIPEEFGQFVADLIDDVPGLRDVTLGVSCSDELFMADSCAVAALMAGAGEVKATSYPLGVSSTAHIAKILADKADDIKVQCGVHMTNIKRLTTQIARICERGQVTSSLFSSPSGPNDAEIALTADDDIDVVSQYVAKLGYELSDEDLSAVYEAFMRIASKKGSVSSRELDAIVASAAMQVPPTYTLDRYVINHGNVIKATATVRMKTESGLVEAVSVGDGPIDAALAAVEQIVGKRYELDDWQMQSVTEGQEAMGEAVIKLMSNGKVYSGRGISTDIVGSSIRAYVNALNKIVYEEQN